MKTWVPLGLILLLTIPAFAQLTVQEETDIRALLKEKQKLIDIAKTLDLETIPLQIAQLKAEREALIAARDAEIKVIQQNTQIQIQAKMDEYEILIDVKESSINGLSAQLNP